MELDMVNYPSKDDSVTITHENGEITGFVESVTTDPDMPETEYYFVVNDRDRSRKVEYYESTGEDSVLTEQNSRHTISKNAVWELNE